jgi:hypothetical protein
MKHWPKCANSKLLGVRRPVGALGRRRLDAASFLNSSAKLVRAPGRALPKRRQVGALQGVAVSLAFAYRFQLIECLRPGGA